MVLHDCCLKNGAGGDLKPRNAPFGTDAFHYMSKKMQGILKVHFSDYFDVSPETLEAAGAFNVSLINDLPLFIDPFLLFNSDDPVYRLLHDEIIRYVRFLRDKSVQGSLNDGLIRAWFTFPEVRQTWLGFSRFGNMGSGLGMDFARALHKNLHTVFSDFGEERVTKGSHLEKLCLIRDGVGRDNVSDFITNLIKEYLLDYTQSFARDQLATDLRRAVTLEKVRFNYETESWKSGRYELPFIDSGWVLLTPKDILTSDELWINKRDIYNDFNRIVLAMPNEQLRAQLNNYIRRQLSIRPTPKERRAALAKAVLEFPKFLDYYIRYKEEHGDRAVAKSEENVTASQKLFVEQLGQLIVALNQQTDFYKLPSNTLDEARERALHLKDIVENKGGHRFFYVDGKPVRREVPDLHILYRLTWFATLSDVSHEVDDGRGQADFKISHGSIDKTIVEFKLAKNKSLERNLQHQVPTYQKASDAQRGLKVIFYFTRGELARVRSILRKLKLEGDPSIILVDARSDNKPSASRA